jgi:hypothetical protein
MKIIPLTRGQSTKVDDDDFERFGGFKWYADYSKAMNGFYAKRMSSYDEDGKQKSIRLHRVIMNVVDPKIQVDHKNHDTLDNQKENLRLATWSQNMMNRTGPQKNSTSGMRGVYWHSRDKNWFSKIKVNGKQIHLGYYSDKESAVAAYASAHKEHFGEFGGGL